MATTQSVQDIISRLKFISTVEPGEKIDVSTQTIMPNTYMNQIYNAFMRSEGRMDTLNFVRQSVTDAFDLLGSYTTRDNSYDRRIAHMIVDALVSSRRGILALTDTYKHDRMLTSRIETLVDLLDAKLSELPEDLRPEADNYTTDEE